MFLREIRVRYSEVFAQALFAGDHAAFLRGDNIAEHVPVEHRIGGALASNIPDHGNDPKLNFPDLTPCADVVRLHDAAGNPGSGFDHFQ